MVGEGEGEGKEGWGPRKNTQIERGWGHIWLRKNLVWQILIDAHSPTTSKICALRIRIGVLGARFCFSTFHAGILVLENTILD